MVVIPSNVIYFILGFISCFILIIVSSIYLIKKEENKRKEITKAYVEMFANIKKKDNKDE